MKVLFSPVGKSDPMTIFENTKVYDGSLIHICRIYKPERVYLYMSQQISEFDFLDNRYERTIHFLDKKIEVIKYKKEELKDVHRFDAFYNEFELLIDNIIKENGPNTEVLVNVSSGTPAMKSALQVISALSKYNIVPIQVDDPSAGQYKRDVDLDDYNVQSYWEYNLDNQVTSNRTYISSNDDFNLRIQKEIIINLVNSLDYNAAYKVAKEYENKVSEELINLLKFAKERSEFDTNRALTTQRKLKLHLFPYESGDKIKLFEYALILKNNILKEETLYFLRGLNPFLYNALNKLFKEKYKYSVEDYCIKGKLERYALERDDRGKQLLVKLDSFYKRYEAKYPSEDMLIRILEKDIDNKRLKNSLNNLNELRKTKRNQASHQMICIKEDLLKDLKHSLKTYQEDIKNILKHFGYDVDKYWDSYNDMNQIIISKLKG